MLANHYLFGFEQGQPFFHSEKNLAFWGSNNFFITMNDLEDNIKLILIKVVHTLIWIFFNVVIFYMLYAAIAHKLDLWLLIGYGFIFLEGLILLAFKSHCPLNLLARKYTNSKKDNFDIYLPSWLAKYTKLIYTTIFTFITIITLYQLLN